jgi:hypothetical protein
LKPKLCRANRAGEVLAEIIFLSEGVRMPNFIFLPLTAVRPILTTA